MKKITIIAFCVAAGLVFSAAAEAGKLRRFERAVTKPKPAPSVSAPPSGAVVVAPMVVAPCAAWPWRCGYGWWDDMWMRHPHHPAPSSEQPPGAEFTRLPGDYLLPEFRLETNFQAIDRDISAIDLRVDIGYRAADIALRESFFYDRATRERLHILYGHALLRLVPDAHMQWDLGAGMVNLRGLENSAGLSVTTALTLAPWPSMAVSLQPAWSFFRDNLLQDFDIKLAYTLPYASLHAGYRWLAGPGEGLSGPVFGAAYRW